MPSLGVAQSGHVHHKEEERRASKKMTWTEEDGTHVIGTRTVIRHGPTKQRNSGDQRQNVVRVPWDTHGYPRREPHIQPQHDQLQCHSETTQPKRNPKSQAKKTQAQAVAAAPASSNTWHTQLQRWITKPRGEPKWRETRPMSHLDQALATLTKIRLESGAAMCNACTTVTYRFSTKTQKKAGTGRWRPTRSQTNLSPTTTATTFADEGTREAKQRDLNIWEEFVVYDVVLVDQAEEKQWATTRCDIDHRVGGEVRARCVAREFKKAQFMDDLFAPSSGHWTTSLSEPTTFLNIITVPIECAGDWRNNCADADVDNWGST